MALKQLKCEIKKRNGRGLVSEFSDSVLESVFDAARCSVNTGQSPSSPGVPLNLWSGQHRESFLTLENSAKRAAVLGLVLCPPGAPPMTLHPSPWPSLRLGIQ